VGYCKLTERTQLGKLSGVKVPAGMDFANSVHLTDGRGLYAAAAFDSVVARAEEVQVPAHSIVGDVCS
jgi:hypothetical protein